jgi:hypothetical protein
MRSAMTIVAASIFLATTPSLGNPIAPDHPFVGTWKITLSLSEGSCEEIYRVRPDGRTLITSAEEEGESEYEISDEPSDKGFYKLVGTATAANGKKDCLGRATRVGHVATTYVAFHPSGDMFVMCIEESLDRCIGPFVRQKDGGA